MVFAFQRQYCLYQGSVTYLPRAGKQNHAARSPFTNCSNCMARLVVLHFMNLSSSQLFVLHTYEELLMRNHTVL